MVTRQLKTLSPFVLIIIALTTVVINMDNTLRTQSAEKSAQIISFEAARVIKQSIQHANDDLHFLVELAATKNYLLEQTPSNRKALTNIVKELISSRKDYAQIRLLSLDGIEQIRLDLKEHRLVVVDLNSLQDKSDRYYFKEAQNLQPGQVYQSQLDLNMEFGQIEYPIRPTVRFVQKVFHQGKAIGYLVINFNFNIIFDALNNLRQTNQHNFSLINRDGYYLFSNDENQNWGFMFNEPDNTIGNQHGEFWQILTQNNQHHDAIETDDNAFFVQELCAASNCHDSNSELFILPNAAKDLPWYLVSQAKSNHWYNLEWLKSEWPYFLAVILLITILLVYRIGKKLDDSIDHLQEQQVNLNKVNDRLEKVIESIPDGFIILGNNKRIAVVNAALEKILGMSKKQLIGEPIEVFMSGHFKIQHVAFTDSFFENPRRIEVTRERPYVYKHANGSTRYLQATISPLEFENEVIAIVLVKDVTNSLKQEEQVKQSQKLDALGQLTGGVAHDFNNLLAIMLGNLQLMELQVKDNEKLQQRITKILNAVNTASDLTQKLLTVSRRKTLSVEEVDVKQFMEDVFDMLQRTIKQQKVRISCHVDDDLPKIMVDPHELTNALINLAVNARDAMPEGGDIFIRAESTYLDHAYVNNITDTVAEGHYVLISFEDTGSGIPSALIDKVLEPFFTTKPKGKGTGLGLAMIYGFVKQSKGHMRIYSEEGSGTNIHIYLPVSKQNIVPVQTASKPQVAPISWTTYRALVVDDEVDLAEVAASYLELAGMQVDVCHNADKAWEMVQSNDYQLVFSDIVMPGEMDGIDLFKKVKDYEKDVRIVLASGFSEEMLSQQYKLQDKLIFIRKPYKREEMLDAIEKALT